MRITATWSSPQGTLCSCSEKPSSGTGHPGMKCKKKRSPPSTSLPRSSRCHWSSLGRSSPQDMKYSSRHPQGNSTPEFAGHLQRGVRDQSLHIKRNARKTGFKARLFFSLPQGTRCRKYCPNWTGTGHPDSWCSYSCLRPGHKVMSTGLLSSSNTRTCSSSSCSTPCRIRIDKCHIRYLKLPL